MAEQYFDVDAALKEPDTTPSEVAAHLAQLHNVDRDSYLKEGLTDDEFLNEFKHKPLPGTAETKPVEQVPTVSNSTNAAFGVAGAAVPTIATGAFKRLMGTQAQAPAAAPAPAKPAFTYETPEQVRQRVIATGQPTRPEGPSDVVNWAIGKDPKTGGQYGRGYLGGTSMEHEADLHRQADMLEAKNPGYKVKQGTSNLLIPQADYDKDIAQKEAARKSAAAELNNQAKMAAEVRAQRLAQIQPTMPSKIISAVQTGLQNTAAAPVLKRGAVGYNVGDYLQAQNPFEQTVSAVGAGAPIVAAGVKKVLPARLKPIADVIGTGASVAAPAINWLERKLTAPPEQHAEGGQIQGYAGGKLVQQGLSFLERNAPAIKESLGKIIPSLAHEPTPLPSVFVHGTTPEAAAAIRASGKFDPNAGTRLYSYSELGPKTAYFAPENSWWHNPEKAASGRAEIYKDFVKTELDPSAKVHVIDTPDQFDKLAQKVGYQNGEHLKNALGVGDLDLNKAAQDAKNGTFNDFLQKHFKDMSSSLGTNINSVEGAAKEYGMAPHEWLKENLDEYNSLINYKPPYDTANKATQDLINNGVDGLYFSPKFGELARKTNYAGEVSPDQLALFNPELAKILDHAKGGQIEGYDLGGAVKGAGKLLNQHPEVAKALESYLRGNISNADRLAVVNKFLPTRQWSELPPAYTDEQIRNALMANKQPKALADVPAGMRVGNRLDIPAYTQNGVYVDTVHALDSGNTPISYNRTGHLTDVDFSSKPNQAARVGLGTKEQALTPLGAEMGSGKSPFALIKGTNVGTSDDEVRRMMQEYLKDPNWTQIGMDPRKGSQFYDKSTNLPVFSAEQKLQSGPLVLVPKQGLETSHWQDPRLQLSDERLMLSNPEEGLHYKEGGHATPAWQRSEGKNPEGGLNALGRASYNREHGAHLKAPQPEGGSRRDSFCARMEGMKDKLTSSETAKDPDSRINKSLRKWKC